MRFTQHTEYAVDHCVEAHVQTAGGTLEDDDVYGSQMTMHQIYCSCLSVSACVVLNASRAGLKDPLCSDVARPVGEHAADLLLEQHGWQHAAMLQLHAGCLSL